MDAVNSPLLAREVISPAAQVPITEVEVRTLVRMSVERRAHAIAIGSGRDPVCRASAHAVARAWRRSGGDVALELDWPEVAASWLRPATRFAAAGADLWIMLGPAPGWAQMTRRLLWSTPWRPASALLAGDVSDPDILELVGLADLDGIAGTTREGGAWHLSAATREAVLPRRRS